MKKKKTKISWKTIIAMIMFLVSTLAFILVAAAPLCLTWTGAVFTISMVTIAGYSLNYLFERYEKIR